jgi:hypothetical protein
MVDMPNTRLSSDSENVSNNGFFSSLGQAFGYMGGALVGTAAQALPVWTNYQLQKQMGNQLAQPTFYAPAADPRLQTPLYTTQPAQWSVGGGAVTIDQYGNIVPSYNAGYQIPAQQNMPAQQSMVPLLLIGGAAILALVVLTR